jgi:mRNA interferase RelE/StbE
VTNTRYNVQLTRPATRTLHRLPTKLADAVLRFCEGPLTENPMRVTKNLGVELEGVRSGYVGVTYRVLVQIDENTKVVYVLRIAHRADAYRSFD